jgi:hypothetical protein
VLSKIAKKRVGDACP